MKVCPKNCLKGKQLSVKQGSLETNTISLISLKHNICHLVLIEYERLIYNIFTHTDNGEQKITTLREWRSC